MRNQTAERQWSINVDGFFLGSLCVAGLFFKTREQDLQLVSYQGEIIKTIDVAKEIIDTIWVIDDRYLLAQSDPKISIFDIQENRRIIQFELDTMKCVFDAGMNEEQTVVVFASDNTHLYVLRLREDLSNEQRRNADNFSKIQQQ